MSITATGEWFHNALKSLLTGAINVSTDTVKMALLNAVPSLETAVHWSDVSADDISPTAGGNALTSISVTETTANSWSDAWTASTAYAVGQVIRPATGNGNLYRAAVAGTSGSSAPSFPTVFGETVTDSGVTWVNCGTSITVFTAGTATFNAASGTISPEAAVIYDAESGSSSTEPLLALLTFASTPTATTVTVAPDSNLGFASQTFP